MTPLQITLVQDSFAKVEPIAETAAELFYGRLFEIAPSVRSMFGDDMAEQGRKLMRMLSIVCNNLNRLDGIVVAIQRLGEKHAAYGVRPAHYDTVASALLWPLEKGLGAAWNAEVKDAWVAAYTLLAGVMQEAAEAAA